MSRFDYGGNIDSRRPRYERQPKRKTSRGGYESEVHEGI